MKSNFLPLALPLLQLFALASRAQQSRPQNPQPAVPADARQAQQPIIRVNVDRVNVGVLVTGKGGQFIEGLHREDFRILDNGAEQPITGFLPVAEPAQVLVLVESGPAVFFLGKDHFLAAERLLENLSSDDRIAIASYEREPQLLVDFTADKPTARLALEHLNFMGGYRQLNLSSSLGAAVDWLGTQPGKKSIVVLSTGVDMSAPEKWPQIQQKLRTGDVRVLAVSLSGDFRKPLRHKVLSSQGKEDRLWLKKGLAEGERSLRELSLATGGRVYFPRNQKEFDRAYTQIAQLLRHEYSLAFTPPAHDGQLHAIEVQVKGSGRRVDHRQAYLAPAPSSP